VPDPGPALSIGAQAGALGSVKVENMQAQHDLWLAAANDGPVTPEYPGDAPAPVAVGLVAIARGAGIVEAYRGLGATVVLEPMEGAKTSAGEMIEAARHAGTAHAILLPNDTDVLMAAEAAARETEGFLTVVPSPNVAAGLAAAIYYRAEGEPDEIASAMTDALAQVRSVEVSTASRDASVDGVAVRAGEAIAFVDGRLRAAASSHDDALLAGLAIAVSPDAELVTVYLGAEALPGAEARLIQRIGSTHPTVEVEIMRGGQPHYTYIATVE
jgi:dihydroxyacetone kinase-like predicted kinase